MRPQPMSHLPLLASRHSNLVPPLRISSLATRSAYDNPSPYHRLLHLLVLNNLGRTDSRISEDKQVLVQNKMKKAKASPRPIEMLFFG
ncbi:hypothetical protein QJS10_CPA03g02059 [Acorus calamus]|uniref:Uncharacterized protein n=1 Tax=Acorus calamus TaxID=4465 RepID=A0AAV9FAK0_ACOCL|nr:hypothetical protein QJS10_CPA03g02059 [Acorus calamus]